MDASQILDVVRPAVPGAVLEEAVSVDMPTVYVDREHLLEVCQILRDSSALEFAFLSDLTARRFPRAGTHRPRAGFD